MAFLKPIMNFLNKSIGPPMPSLNAAPPLVSSSSVETQNLLQTSRITLEPINVSGFYTVTAPAEATFYAMTDVPLIPVGPGWYSTFIIGVQGKIRVKSVSLNSGPGYRWSFVFQVYTSQNIQGTQQVTSATLYPPEQAQVQGVQVPLYGYYTVTAGVMTFFFTITPTQSPLTGWIVTGLAGIPMLKITNCGNNYATLVPVDGSTLRDTTTTVKVNGFPASLQQASVISFTPGKFTDYDTPGDFIPNVQVKLNSNIKVGNYAPLRDLNTDVSWTNYQPDGRIFPQSPMIEPGTGIKGWQPPP